MRTSSSNAAVRQNTNFVIFKSALLEVRLLEDVAENLTNSTTSGKCRNIATLIEIRYDELVTFHNISYL